MRDRISALELKLAELTGAIDILRGTPPPPERDSRALGELLSTEHRKFGDHPLTGIELAPCAVSNANKNPDDMFSRANAALHVGSSFRRMVTRLGPAAKMPFPIHPHMLRHSTGFKLANQGVDTRSLQHYLGHKNIQHTVRYSELTPERFRDFWKD